jgi:catechol 2,3-dioxygenase-like lactoylglutathione lyase family enzyme
VGIVLNAAPDHVAIAVPDWDIAERRWVDVLGGRVVSWSINPTFRSRQYRFANGAKLELLTLPEVDVGADHFVRRFLDRFGASVHHLTLKVADIHDAIAAVRDAGFDVIDERTDGAHWKEAFLRPAQVGGFVVQLGWSSFTDAEIAARRGHTPEDPPSWAARLIGPHLRHPELDRARSVWTTLGGEVSESDGGLDVRWPGAPLTVRVDPGMPAGPIGLRMAWTDELPADPVLGPLVLVAREAA